VDGMNYTAQSARADSRHGIRNKLQQDIDTRFAPAGQYKNGAQQQATPLTSLDSQWERDTT
jgi:hypothetical protein